MQSVDLVCEKNGEEVKRKKGTPSLEILCSDGVHQRSGWLVLVDSVFFLHFFLLPFRPFTRGVGMDIRFGGGLQRVFCVFVCTTHSRWKALSTPVLRWEREDG